MKKIIQLFASIFTVAPLISNVVSCKDVSKWESFQNFVNDKNSSYLIMIDGADADDSKNMHSELWDPISTNPSKSLSNLYQSTDPNESWNSYINAANPSVNQNTHQNIKLGSEEVKFENLEGQVQSKLWNEDWAKNILNWCGEKSWEYTTGGTSGIEKNKSYVKTYISKYESTSSPEFIYIKKGEYMGIHQFSDLKFSKTSSNNSGLTFYEWSYDIFINNEYSGN